MMAAPGENVKITVVGDGVVGKTCLLIAYLRNEFLDEYVPTIFENHGQKIVANNVEYTMALMDTAGQEDYARLRPLTYPNTHCFLLCYAVDNKTSYKHVETTWISELRHYNPQTPILLVATKIDLRDDSSVQCYTYQDGRKLMNKIKAQGYVECSAKSRVGVENVFIEAINVHKKGVVVPKRKQAKCMLI